MFPYIVQDPVPQGLFAAKPEPDAPVGPQFPEMKAEVKAEEGAEQKQDSPAAPVSKWTLVDYDDDPQEAPDFSGYGRMLCASGAI